MREVFISLHFNVCNIVDGFDGSENFWLLYGRRYNIKKPIKLVLMNQLFIVPIHYPANLTGLMGLSIIISPKHPRSDVIGD